MNDILKEKIQRLAEDTLLMNALRTVFYERIEQEKPKIETTDDNNLLGEKFRAYEQAQNLLQEVFLDIQAYQTGKNNIKGFNKEI